MELRLKTTLNKEELETVLSQALEIVENESAEDGGYRLGVYTPKLDQSLLRLKLKFLLHDLKKSLSASDQTQRQAKPE